MPTELIKHFLDFPNTVQNVTLVSFVKINRYVSHTLLSTWELNLETNSPNACAYPALRSGILSILLLETISHIVTETKCKRNSQSLLITVAASSVKRRLVWCRCRKTTDICPARTEQMRFLGRLVINKESVYQLHHEIVKTGTWALLLVQMIPLLANC